MTITSALTLAGLVGGVFGGVFGVLRRVIPVLSRLLDVLERITEVHNGIAQTTMLPRIAALEARQTEVEAATERRYRSMQAVASGLGTRSRREEREAEIADIRRRVMESITPPAPAEKPAPPEKQNPLEGFTN